MPRVHGEEWCGGGESNPKSLYVTQELYHLTTSAKVVQGDFNPSMQ